ncbi:MAG TPA: hypothetical protein DEF61_04825 [Firmicutes bacterium]|nr:hypothetical protein [Bacillota bacterium]HBX25551.1 hypothetical protein [Bacillota bacterium]
MKFKPSKKEFLVADLPVNRKAQFFDFFKTRPMLFLEIGLLLLLFFSPFLVAFIFKYYVVLLPAYNSLSETEYISFYLTNSLVFDFVYCLCFLFVFIGLSGIGRIIRQWAWGNGIYFWHDFIKGVKQNIKAYLLFWLLFSVFYFVSDLLVLTMGNFFTKYIFAGISLLLFPVLIMGMCLSLIYSDRPLKLLINSFSYCLKRPFYTFLFLLFPYGVLCLNLIDQIMVLFLVVVILILIIFPLYMVAWHLYCLSLFDDFTNKEYYPNLYKKGLREEYIKENEETISNK